MLYFSNDNTIMANMKHSSIPFHHSIPPPFHSTVSMGFECPCAPFNIKACIVIMHSYRGVSMAWTNLCMKAYTHNIGMGFHLSTPLHHKLFKQSLEWLSSFHASATGVSIIAVPRLRQVEFVTVVGSIEARGREGSLPVKLISMT